MNLLLWGLGGWIVGSGWSVAFIAAGTSRPTPSPFVWLDNNTDLCWCA